MIQTNINFPIRSQILSFAFSICSSPVLGCSVVAVLLARSLLPYLFIKVSWPNSGLAQLGEGTSWKAANKDLGTKSKDLLCWKKKMGALLSLHLFINVFLISRFSSWGCPGCFGWALCSFFIHCCGVIKVAKWLFKEKSLSLCSPGGTWTALRWKVQSRISLVKLCEK